MLTHDPILSAPSREDAVERDGLAYAYHPILLTFSGESAAEKDEKASIYETIDVNQVRSLIESLK
jgi:hypothetical protein